MGPSATHTHTHFLHTLSFFNYVPPSILFCTIFLFRALCQIEGLTTRHLCYTHILFPYTFSCQTHSSLSTHTLFFHILCQAEGVVTRPLYYIHTFFPYLFLFKYTPLFSHTLIFHTLYMDNNYYPLSISLTVASIIINTCTSTFIYFVVLP